MDQNDPKSKDFTTFLAENPDFMQQLEQFKSQSTKVLTQPSILLKGGISELNLNRLTPKEVEQYLLMHPVVARGIEIKANRMTSRGYRVEPRSETTQAKEAAKDMGKLLDVSGGEILVNGFIRDAYGFGNGYLTLLPDKETEEVVYLSKEHPVFFRIAREKKDQDKKALNENTTGDFVEGWGSMKIDSVTKRPKGYTQVVYAKGNKNRVEPYGNELTSDQVAHLVFNTWGDEAEGVPLVQYIYLNLKYLMNIEEAGAEAIFRSGFTQKKITTNIKNEKELKQLSKHLEKINTSDSIILPEGTDVENLIPGATEFDKVHEIFLNLIAIRLGIPKPILTLDGTNTNKATMQELMRDLIYDIHADELKVKQVIEEQIFKVACRAKYGEDFEDYPVFVFNDFEEGREEKAMIMNLTADYVVKLTNAFKTLQENGQPEAATRVLQLMVDSIPLPDSVEQGGKKDRLIVKVVEKKPEPAPSVPTQEQPKPAFPVKKKPVVEKEQQN